MLDKVVRHDTPRVVTYPNGSHRHGAVWHRAAISAAPLLPFQPDPPALSSSPPLGEPRRGLDAVDGDGTKGVVAFNIYPLPEKGERHGKDGLQR